MKLALIRRHYSASGGAEQYLQRLLAAMVDSGHQVHLFAEHWQNTPPGVSFVKVPVSGSRSQKPVVFAEAVDRLVSAETFDCVFSLERTLKQDVYRAGDGVHRVWLKRRKQFAPWWKKLLIGLGAFHRNMQWLEAQTFSAASTRHIIVNSEMVRREILENFTFPRERIHLVRNGVVTTRFQGLDKAQCRRKWNLNPEDYVVLFCGSGWERKGLTYLLEALPKTAPFKLLVVGKGNQSLAPRSNVIFAGVLDEIELAYAAADLFAFPPIYEPSSNVVIEALAAGLPVITTVQNGASEWITEEVNGTVLPDPSDISALHNAILKWHSRSGSGYIIPKMSPAQNQAIQLDRNVSETLGILELAAKERRNDSQATRTAGGGG